MLKNHQACQITSRFIQQQEGSDQSIDNIVMGSFGEILQLSEKILIPWRLQDFNISCLGLRRGWKRSSYFVRFSRDVNHCVTSQLVNLEGIKTYVLEDLKGIRAKRRGKKLNKRLGSWPFHQFEFF